MSQTTKHSVELVGGPCDGAIISVDVKSKVISVPVPVRGGGWDKVYYSLRQKSVTSKTSFSKDGKPLFDFNGY